MKKFASYIFSGFLLILYAVFLFLMLLLHENAPIYKTFTTLPGNASGSVTSSVNFDGKLDVNKATKEELMELPGIGDVLSERIIAYREEFDGINNVDELLEIKGIGPNLLEKIKPYVTIGD